jgi:hypothetical protein
MRKQTVIQTIASASQALHNCKQSGNTLWQERWETLLTRLEQEALPQGFGINSGCKIDREKSNESKVYIDTGYHHMNEGGFYDGWTYHVVTISPAFDGIVIRISGRNRNDIKEYLEETFHRCLMRECVVDVVDQKIKLV